MPDTLFETSGDELLISVYQKQGRTLDDLPYTPQFEAIYAAIAGGDGHGGGEPALTRQALFHRLHNLRKAGRLPRLGRAATRPLRIAAEHEQLLADLVTQRIGKLSLRDQLLYTPAFDDIVNAFNLAAGLNLSAHDAWRIVAKLAK